MVKSGGLFWDLLNGGREPILTHREDSQHVIEPVWLLRPCHSEMQCWVLDYSCRGADMFPTHPSSLHWCSYILRAPIPSDLSFVVSLGVAKQNMQHAPVESSYKVFKVCITLYCLLPFPSMHAFCATLRVLLTVVKSPLAPQVEQNDPLKKLFKWLVKAGDLNSKGCIFVTEHLLCMQKAPGWNPNVSMSGREKALPKILASHCLSVLMITLGYKTASQPLTFLPPFLHLLVL